MKVSRHGCEQRKDRAGTPGIGSRWVGTVGKGRLKQSQKPHTQKRRMGGTGMSILWRSPFLTE